MNIVSPAFKDQSFIPLKYCCQGAGVSPPLSFVNVPGNAKSLVLLMGDPDAARGIFDHWVVFNIPKGTREIKEGASPAAANFGDNSSGKTSYISPCPPPGKAHRYIFSLFALDGLLPLKDGADKEAVKKAMEGHVLAEARLTGLYKR